MPVTPTPPGLEADSANGRTSGLPVTPTGGSSVSGRDPAGAAGASPIDARVEAAAGSRRRLRRTLALLAFWSVPALLVTALTAAESDDIGFGRAFLAYGLPWYFWAAVTPTILALARRFPLDAPSRTRMLAAHFLAGLSAGTLQGCTTASAHVLFGARTAEVTTRMILIDIVFWIPLGLMFYGATVSIGFALDNQRRLRDRDVLASRMHAQLVEAQLGALRMQLQPHFLFNALNAIAMLVRQGESQTAVRMLARLSELLRHILEDGGAQEAPLEEELGLLGRYLEIEQVRFGDRLSIALDVAADTRAALVPTFLLQPLVENAVRHGIAHRSSPGVIRLTAAHAAGALHLRIRNDGPALPVGWSMERHAGIGLRNTAKRLRHLYGEGATLAVESATDGVEVIIRIPFHTRPGPPLEAPRA
jgi:two-component sensor histidine kinase